MNRPIVWLFALVLVLFAALVGATSRWTVFEAEALRENAANRRGLLAEERIRRGRIRTADGTLIAGSVARSGGRYARRYPLGALFGHPIGYAYTRLGRAGLEQSYNDQLTGRRTELIGVIDSLLGEDKVGDDVRTTLDAEAQRVALERLGGRRGGVVALDAESGAVLVMASTPGFDPNRVEEEEGFEALNRTTQGLYPPGSTFKVVTAAAALDSGSYTPGSRVSGANGKVISGVPLNNFGNQDFGAITLTDALTNSVNTVWAEVGTELGRGTMTDYMERFGFFEDPELDYPDDQIVRSGVRKDGRLVRPTAGSVDLGRMSIGQGDLLVTPLQMAMVAQTVANGGVRMEPRLVAKVVDPDGRTLEEETGEEAGRVMSEESARQLGAMMRNVVREGTGTAAALEGVEVAGKTGTAELDIARRINQPWFIGFSGGIAIAVTVENVQAGAGGTIAAPIARDVLRALGDG